MGYSVRSDVYRATFWMWWDGLNLVGDFAREPAAVELYKHEGDVESDFDSFENVNIAEHEPAVLEQHMSIARSQWGQKQEREMASF